MKSFVDAIINAEKYSTKEGKFKALSNLSDVGKRLMVEALSPYRVFGVKKYKEPKVYDTSDASPEMFFELLDMLHSRQLTGNAARDMVTRILSNYTEETAKILKRVLNKDLKAGFSETTLNKIYPNLIPTFDVMLAQKKEDDTEIFYPCIAEVKYDGQRTIAIIEKNNVTYYGRSGKISFQWEGLFDNELIKMRNHLNEDIVVDGEVMGDSYIETMNAKSEDNILAKEKLKFFAFDIMTLKEWKSEISNKTQINRSKELENLINQLKLEKVKKSEWLICDTPKDLNNFYENVVNNGGEGLIIKDLNGKYEWKRSKLWLKYKPVYTYDGIITGFYPGKLNSKYENTLGGIEIEGEDENGRKFKSSVGSGFSDELRDEIWNNQKSYLGKMVEVEAQEISQSNNEYSLRFPVFKCFRNDK
jgi:ATP-dependent DNA ligase